MAAKRKRGESWEYIVKRKGLLPKPISLTFQDDPRYFTLPVVAMTAHAMVEERERCQAIGMNGHLSKPIEPDEFYATLARYYTAPKVPVVAVPSTQSVTSGADIHAADYSQAGHCGRPAPRGQQ